MTNEKELLLLISSSDEKAFMRLFDLYAKKVYEFINNLLKNPTESEDLTQVVFIKIWEKRATLKEVNYIGGYLFTIAHRTAIDYFRSSRGKHAQLIDYTNTYESVKHENTTEDYLNKHEFEQIYNEGLSTLPPKRKEIFILSRHKGFTNKEIAEKLSISVKTVENQMTSALFYLKSHFKKHDIDCFVLVSVFLFFE